MPKRILTSFLLAGLLPTLACAQSAAPAPARLSSFAAHYALNPNLPTLWIVGASAVRNGHDTGNDGQWGWGNPIASFFDRSRINVVNFALGGTSTRTYQAMGLWDHVLGGTLHGNGEETQEIDNLKTKKHEIVHTYGWYIRKFITDARAKGAVCEIVLSPDPKNTWKDGKVPRSDNFTAWASAAAKQENALFVDANELIAEKFEAAGQEAVTQQYFPEHETEHTDWAGAIVNASCIVAGIRQLDHCDLTGYLLPTPPSDLPLPSGKAR